MPEQVNPLHRRGGEGAERSEAGEAGTHEYLTTYAPIPHLTLALSAPLAERGCFPTAMRPHHDSAIAPVRQI
jgi:hypothetical protein